MAVEHTDDARLSEGDRNEWTLQDEDARRYVHRAVDATVGLVESTFGPRGMEKLVVTEDLQNRPEEIRLDDAGRLLEAIERGEGFTHPIAALFVDSVADMYGGLHDGTTTAVLLAGALLDEGFELVERGVAPSSVVVGYAIARSQAGEVLDDLARPIEPEDHAAIANVAATTMTTELDPAVRERLADHVATAIGELAAVRDDGWINTDDAKVLASRGVDPAIHDGLVLARPEDADPTGRELEEPIEDARVAILDSEINLEETASVIDDVQLSSAEGTNRYTSELAAHIESIAEGLRARGVDVMVCQDALDESVARPLEQAGIVVVDKAKYPKEDVHRLARATGGAVVSNVADLSDDRLGRAGRVTQRHVGESVWTAFEDCPGPVRTLTTGGETAAETTRREQALEDAIETAGTAAIDGQVLPGAGASAMAVATAVRESARSVEGHERLALVAFADALERLPRTLARNAGHDPITAVTSLRNAHTGEGRSEAGVDPATGMPMDAVVAGVLEPRRVFSQAIETAAAAVERLLTVDAVLYPNVRLQGYTPRPENK
ncbi:TCP-1/cpn60 chaperonin family protein [Halopenitus sp. H-Gu1]|uniref:TCP-1/cpn60 chaperonin family protein n=1 Tax=Halopenitus sp. H-Gu1 TaxID=3242697 RepID=UPI00359E093E